MPTEHEELRGLMYEAEFIRNGYEPWKAGVVEEMAAEVRERITYFEDLRSEIMALATNQALAGQEWAVISREESDMQHRCSVLASSLLDKGLISYKECQTVREKLVFIPTVGQVERRKAAEEKRKINDTIEQVLRLASDRQRALSLYNLIELTRSWEKIDQWVKSCVKEDILPKTFSAGLKGGLTLEKALHPFENKELKAGANK